MDSPTTLNKNLQENEQKSQSIVDIEPMLNQQLRIRHNYVEYDGFFKPNTRSIKRKKETSRHQIGL